MSQDIKKRLHMHNVGMTRSTKSYRPRKVIYQEEVGDIIIARKREKYLKSGVGREFIKDLF